MPVPERIEVDDDSDIIVNAYGTSERIRESNFIGIMDLMFSKSFLVLLNLNSLIFDLHF